MAKDTPNRNDQAEEIQRQIKQALSELEQIQNTQHSITSPADLLAAETVIINATDKLAALMTALKIQEAVDSDELKEKADQLVQSMPSKFKNQGRRLVSIQTSRGEPVKVAAPYFNRKKQKKRAHEGSFYPMLLLQGVYDHFTPSMSSEVSMLAAMLSSFEETSRVFKDRGVCLGINTIRRVAQSYASRAKIAQRIEQYPVSDTLGQRRVIISTDGGRIRIRKNKRGPRTKKNRRRYTTHWREPKLVMVYTVDVNGKMDRSFTPVIEGTLKGPDAVFGLLCYHLRQLNIGTADKILFVADGARWIWNRIPELIKSLGLSGSNVCELVDFYHAVEHLAKAADFKKNWKRSEKKRWIKKHRRLLLKGHTEQVVAANKALCRGRNSKEISRERNYFIRNQHRMQYGEMSELKLPIGSGAMESAIRRVVNLRMKGAGIYWLESTAEAMLMLRSYYKAGRWNLLKNLSFSLAFLTNP
jgi:hypothetical protein